MISPVVKWNGKSEATLFSLGAQLGESVRSLKPSSGARGRGAQRHAHGRKVLKKGWPILGRQTQARSRLYAVGELAG